MKEPKNYNYNYYEHQATEAFVIADETGDNARAQLFLLDSVARSLASIADVLENVHGLEAPKMADYDLGLVEGETDDNG